MQLKYRGVSYEKSNSIPEELKKLDRQNLQTRF